MTHDGFYVIILIRIKTIPPVFAIGYHEMLYKKNNNYIVTTFNELHFLSEAFCIRVSIQNPIFKNKLYSSLKCNDNKLHFYHPCFGTDRAMSSALK